MRVALLQFAAGPDVVDNLDQLGRLARESVRDVGGDLQLLVAPEAAQAEFGPPDRSLRPVAESLDGRFVTELGKVAAELRTTIIAGMFEEGPDEPDREMGRVYNTLVTLGPDGTLVGTYRKAHLYDAFGVRESDRMVPGDADPVVLDIAEHRVGLATCYDLRFPELMRLLAEAGAEVLAVPAAWHRGPLKEDHWTTLVRARAIENTCYVAAAAQSAPHYCGRSMLVDPLGVVSASLGEEPGQCSGRVSRERIEEVRRRNPTLKHRRFTVVGPKDGA